MADSTYTFEPFKHFDGENIPQIEVSKTDPLLARHELQKWGFEMAMRGAFVRNNIVFGFCGEVEDYDDFEESLRRPPLPSVDRIAKVVQTLTAASLEDLLTSTRISELNVNVRHFLFDDEGYAIDPDRGEVQAWPVRFFFAAQYDRS